MGRPLLEAIMSGPCATMLTAHPESIKRARDFVGKAVESWGVDVDIARLVISELATNAVTHACGDCIVVRASLNDDGSVTLEAWDKDAGRIPEPRRPDLHATSGRGLCLIENLTRSWGVRPLADQAGKIVYAVLAPINA
ncbi:ATP-binding protein [Actinomadura macrotermitis]|uniref:Histidine kinase/HSP90-like ATPase domain-containing protein n=1 Tax=Actinomadura macrotermitis TaxID=2585200 RepID=A0A7K0BQG9_9ACTN|nr:ATP-binding protein [Actinomadura macrotermitis]MQY03448.1 hypothetical protein [Actinomadura macrotermitis]